jgi:hypothetical protein
MQSRLCGLVFQHCSLDRAGPPRHWSKDRAHRAGCAETAGCRPTGYGILFEDMLVPSGGELPITKMIQPKVEAEVALVLGTDLSNPEITPDAVLDATESAVAVI